ncbi:hypothetical protein ACP70R_015028 [Stipagrostis hirtigluma subsp. patula]
MEPERLPCASSSRGSECVDAGGTAIVRRSSVAPGVTCGLCGGILRDATTVSECLHSSKCIFQKLLDEDINCCPTCSTYLGCDPLEKLRADHGLQHIRSMIFPAKKRKFEEISSLQPALGSLLSPSPKTCGRDHSAKKTDAYLMGQSMNSNTEIEAGEKIGVERSASPTKPSALSIDRFRHLPPSNMTIWGGDEIQEEIAPNIFMRKPCIGTQVLETSEEGHTSKMMLVSDYIYGVLTCDITYGESAPLTLHPLTPTTADPPCMIERESTPLTLHPPTPTTSDPPCTVGRIGTTLSSVTSSETQDMELWPSISELAVQSEELKCNKDHDTGTKQAVPQERNTLTEEEDALIVATTEEMKAMAAAESTLSSVVEISAEKGAALPPVASECEAQEVAVENTARTLERIEAYTDRREALVAENARLRKELENEITEKAVAIERTRILEEDRLQRESEIAQSAAVMSEKLEAYLSRSQALEVENARLREELDNERAEKAAAIERTGVLEDRVQIEAQKFQREFEIVQKAEASCRQLSGDYQPLESGIAAVRLLFHDYQALESEISEKIEECATLQYNNDMLEKEKTCLENQLDHLTKCLAQRTARIFERLEAYIGRFQASEAENASLREELDEERAKSVAASEKIRVLQNRLQRESEIAQRTETALGQLLSDYQALESEISEESEEHATLQYSF